MTNDQGDDGRGDQAIALHPCDSARPANPGDARMSTRPRIAVFSTLASSVLSVPLRQQRHYVGPAHSDLSVLARNQGRVETIGRRAVTELAAVVSAAGVRG